MFLKPVCGTPNPNVLDTALQDPYSENFVVVMQIKNTEYGGVCK